MRNARIELGRIEESSVNYCKDDQQKKLIRDLNNLADDIKEIIEDWEQPYLIYTNNVKTKKELKQMIDIIEGKAE